MEIKTKELVEAEVVLLVIGEVFNRLCRFYGSETLFGFDEDMFFIAKQEKLIIGNHSMVINCNAKGLDPKTCGVIKDFKLTYSKLHEMEIEPMSFKKSVYRAGEWLGLPL